MTTAVHSGPMPRARPLGRRDLDAALKAGLADFRRAPAFGLFFGAVFCAIGIVVFLQLVVWRSGYWVIPIAAGFPLAGPFLAVGLYEVSRRIEAGEPLDWASVLRVPVREGSRQIPMMAFVALFFYLSWVYLAHLLFALFFGLKPLASLSLGWLISFEGILMLLIGSAIGSILAVLLFSISVFSVPMLLDRDVDVVTAMVASVRAVLENRGPMLGWGVVIGVASLVAMVPLFLGILVVFPVLGHAAWHLYRRAFAPG